MVAKINPENTSKSLKVAPGENYVKEKKHLSLSAWTTKCSCSRGGFSNMECMSDVEDLLRWVSDVGCGYSNLLLHRDQNFWVKYETDRNHSFHRQLDSQTIDVSSPCYPLELTDQRTATLAIMRTSSGFLALDALTFWNSCFLLSCQMPTSDIRWHFYCTWNS